MSQILELIGHYQRSIERSQNGSDSTNNSKLLRCIDKLYRLPITVDHLQATGIGKTVNSLRKYDGEVGVAAKALVAKWKAMVTAEEYASESAATANKTDDDEENSDGNNNNDDDDMNGNVRDNAASSYGDNEQKSNNNNNIAMLQQQKSHDKKSETTKHRSHHSSSHKNDNSKKSSSREHSNSNNNKTKHKSDRKEEKSSQKTHNQQNDYINNESLKALTPKFDENLDTQQCDNDEKLNKCDDSSKIEKHHHNHSSSTSSRDKHSKHHSSSSSKTHHHNNRIDEKSSTYKSSSSSSSSKHRKEHNRDHHKSSSKDKDKSHHKSSSSSSSNNNTNKTKENNSNNKNDENINIKDNKRRHSIAETIDGKICEVTSSSSTTTTTITTPSTSSNKVKKQKIIHHDEIDSTTGTSFEDALGMMIPIKLSNSNSNKNITKIKSPNISKSSISGTSKMSSNNGASSSKINISSTSKISNGTIIPNRVDCDDIRKITPSLLTSSVKLKPLDLDISLELPTISISNNYKPMPLNQTVMDCVFRSNQPQKPTRTDEEALQHSISSKTMRTKVYSGQKSGQRYQAPKLFDLCIRFLQKNIDSIEYCGGYPYEILRHVLERATPPQLLNFEEWNQYIIEDTDELWQKHVTRHCRGQKRQEMESWREMYMRVKENEEQRLNMLAENIKQSQKLVAAPVKKTQLAFVDSMVKPPRNIQRKQDQFGTNKKLIATPAARVASLCNLTPNAIKTGDVRLRIAAGERDNAQVSGFIRPKKAPLMAKTLQLMKGRFKR